MELVWHMHKGEPIPQGFLFQVLKFGVLDLRGSDLRAALGVACGPQPSTTYLALSKVQATAKASPTTGEYLDSAGLVNLDPANTRDQPSLQQVGVRMVQLHCFCSKQKPMPVLLQSVAKQVTFPMSKVFTPSSTALMIISLELLKVSCSSCVQQNSVEGLSRSRSG